MISLFDIDFVLGMQYSSQILWAEFYPLNNVKNDGQFKPKSSGQFGAKSGGQFAPKSSGQFTAKTGGQFAPKSGGQFIPKTGGQFQRNFH